MVSSEYYIDFNAHRDANRRENVQTKWNNLQWFQITSAVQCTTTALHPNGKTLPNHTVKAKTVKSPTDKSSQSEKTKLVTAPVPITITFQLRIVTQSTLICPSPVPLDVELVAPEDHGVDAGQQAVGPEIQHRRSPGTRALHSPNQRQTRPDTTSCT